MKYVNDNGSLKIKGKDNRALQAQRDIKHNTEKKNHDPINMHDYTAMRSDGARMKYYKRNYN